MKVENHSPKNKPVLPHDARRHRHREGLGADSIFAREIWTVERQPRGGISSIYRNAR